MASPPPQPRVVILGEAPQPLRDIYHGLLRRPWSVALGAIAAGFLAVNLVFATLFRLTGGVANVRSFLDAFYFSVQTSATIGYGGMAPTTDLSNLLVVAESVISLVLTAVATGLVFAKFSRSTARMRFTRKVALAPFNGVPTLMIRIGNERGNSIVEAQLHVTLVRTEITAEGERFYRQYDLPLSRERVPNLSRSWTVMHPITRWSPLWEQTPESLAAADVEVSVSVIGTDDTTMQSVHASALYDHTAIAWGMRYADLLSEDADGTFVVDLRRFDDLEATAPIDGFPYPFRP